MRKKYLFNFSFLLFLFFVAFVALPSNVVFASTTDGTVSGSAWSSQIGWINFGTTGGSVHITDSALTGYAWNENTGWITLAPTTSGVVNNSNGTLSGSAFSPGTGWINFTGVTVSSSGSFSGTATGDNSTDINFSCTHCNVTTDWRPASTRSSSSGGGGGGGHGGVAPPSAPYSVSINNGNLYATSATVTLSLEGAEDAVKMALSNSPDFSNAVAENYQHTKVWNLSPQDGLKTVYVKFYTNFGVPSPTIWTSITLDTQIPVIQITSIKSSYGPDESVVVGGIGESNAKVNLLIDNNYGQFDIDPQGNWLITLGKMSQGTHRLELTPKDAAGNTGKTVVASFSVGQGAVSNPPGPSPFTLAPPLAPILRQLAKGIESFVPKIFRPLAKSEPKPVAVITVPKVAPVAMGGAFHYISTKTLSIFVLAPLPKDIKLLAQKFPQVQKTFNQVGIQKITDVQKLVNTNLKLPNLTQAVLPNTQITSGKLTVLKGIPVEKLSVADKDKVPSAVVFSKAAGGLVDFDVALSLNDKGQIQQTIQTVVGHPLQLVVKADRPAKRVMGYIVFKSKNYNKASSKLPADKVTASLLFANPALATAVTPSVAVQVEGNKDNNYPIQVNTIPSKPDSKDNSESSGIEQRLVLSQFEYQNSGEGVYTATVLAPLVDAEYEIITVIEYEDPQYLPKEIRLITVVDPEGYVYEKNGNLETRIAGAVVSLYWLNPDTKEYELWPAKDFQQEDPQTTDVRGTYSFLVPNGYYYLKVVAPGYLSYDGKPFEVKEGSGVHINIELKTKYWFLKIIDWKTALLVLVILLLLYNFYKDRKRDKIKYN